MIIMDVLVEFFLFVINQKPYYYICECNNPVLYINKNEGKNSLNQNINNIKNESINSSKANNINYFNESNKVIDFDHSLYKSLIVCSNITFYYIKY